MYRPTLAFDRQQGALIRLIEQPRLAMSCRPFDALEGAKVRGLWLRRTNSSRMCRMAASIMPTNGAVLAMMPAPVVAFITSRQEPGHAIRVARQSSKVKP
jgi:hypothetical protein